MAELIRASGLVPQVTQLVVDGRQSIAEIVLGAGFRLADFGRLRVTIDDFEVAAERWHRIYPKPAGVQLMQIGVRPMGGGGSGGVLKTVLSVLLVAAAVAITGGAAAFSLGGGPLFGEGAFAVFGAGSFESYLAASLVLSAGQAGLDALFPSAVTSKDKGGVLGNAGARANTLKPGDYLPRPFGTLKTWPPQVTRPIRYFDGQDEVVEALYAVAGRTVLTDVRVGGVLAADADGIQVQVVDWNSPLAEQTLLNRYGAIKSMGRTLQWYTINKQQGEDLGDQSQPLKCIPDWDTFNFPDADEMRLRLTWPQGLSARNDNDAYVHQPMRMRIRPKGSSTWVNFPEFWWRNDETSDYRKDIVIRRAGVGPAIVTNITDDRKTVGYIYTHVPGQGLFTTLADGATANGTSNAAATVRPQTGEWTADASFGTYGTSQQAIQYNVNVAKSQEGVFFSIDTSVLPRGPVEVQLIAGAVVTNSNFDFTLYGMTTEVPGGKATVDMFGYGLHSSYARLYAPNDVQKMNGQVVVSETVAIMHQPPTIGVGPANAALIAVRGRNVQVGDVTAIATSVIYDRATDDWLVTDNPAKLSEALARGEATHRGVSSTIDTAAYDAWAAACTANGYRASFEIAGGRWDDAQKMLASAGRGGFAMARSFRPYYDRNRAAESAVMAFTPANARYVGLSRSWAPVRTDALRITLRDRTDDYAETSRIVYAPGVDAVSYRGLEDVQYPELADVDLGQARALYDLSVARYRGTRLTFETDHAAQAVQKGDLCVCIWDVLAEIDAENGVNERAISQSSYIAGVTRNGGGQITAIELERPVYIEPVSSNFLGLTNVFATPNVMTIGDLFVGLVTVGRQDPTNLNEAAGAVLSFDLAASVAGETTTIPIAAATIPRADQVAPGQIFSVGRRTRLRRRAIVDSITPSDGYFKIVTVPEAPEIWQ